MPPKSGAETRQLIKDKTGEGTDYLKQRGTELKDSAGDLLAKSKEALNRQKDTIADAMEAGKQAYRDAVNQPPQLSRGRNGSLVQCQGGFCMSEDVFQWVVAAWPRVVACLAFCVAGRHFSAVCTAPAKEAQKAGTGLAPR